MCFKFFSYFCCPKQKLIFTRLMKKTIIILLLAAVALAGQSKLLRKIENPVSMACVNVYGGGLKALEVIMSDTSTTVRFSMEYPKGNSFRFAKDSYLIDGEGRRYMLRSAEGIKLDKWVKSPESGHTGFVMHFEPMPKRTQMFDFIEGDGSGAFMLLGIHDSKYKIKAPTLKQLSDANPYAVPGDWFRTDTVTVRGRIEDYDAKRMGFSAMEYFLDDVFSKDNGTVVIDIAPDGTFEKKFCISYPVYDTFIMRNSKIGFDEIPFFIRPGETLDITLCRDNDGRYGICYNSGSSREVERLLKSRLCTGELCQLLFMSRERKISDNLMLADEVWKNMLYRLQTESRRHGFTPMEMQMALAQLQVNFAFAWMEYIMIREDEVKKHRFENGKYMVEITDSAEWLAINDASTYRLLQCIDFDNPLLVITPYYDTFVNRVEYADFVRDRQYAEVASGGVYVYESNAETRKKILYRGYDAIREMTGTGHNSMLSQICLYNDMLSNFNSWRETEERIPEVMADTMNTPAERQKKADGLESLSNMYPAYLSTFEHPYVKAKAENFYAAKMAQTELSTPLPADNASADLIRSIAARYPGRFLLIDFWGMGCGPCRSAIQNSRKTRAEIAGRDDVKLVFIAGERDAKGSESYRKYVDEWLKDEEAICVSHEDFARLRELFKFNGIPHYETITPDCRRVRDDIRIHGLYSDLGQSLDRMMKRLK